MGEKVTLMVLKVNLECPCCYKKVKKILCKFPQIRGQVYNEKDSKVSITVVCCDPERIRDKLCCKGAKVIKSIEIIEPPKPKEPEKPKPKPVEPEPEKPKVVVVEEPKKPDKKVTFVEPPKEPEKPKEKPKEAPKPDPPKPPAPAPAPAPCPPPPQPIMVPVPCGYGYPPAPARTCCGQCSEGYGGGPCYFGYGPPQNGQYGYGHDRPCHVTRCDYYLSEENPQACSIM